MKKQYIISGLGKVSSEEDLRLESQRLAESRGMSFSGLVRWLLMRELQKEKE